MNLRSRACWWNLTVKTSPFPSLHFRGLWDRLDGRRTRPRNLRRQGEFGSFGEWSWIPGSYNPSPHHHASLTIKAASPDSMGLPPPQLVPIILTSLCISIRRPCFTYFMLLTEKNPCPDLLTCLQHGFSASWEDRFNSISTGKFAGCTLVLYSALYLFSHYLRILQPSHLPVFLTKFFEGSHYIIFIFWSPGSHSINVSWWTNKCFSHSLCWTQ